MWPPVSPKTPLLSSTAVKLLAARGAVDDLLQALGHHVAVALQGEDEAVGQHALHAGRHRRRAAVQRLQDVDVHDRRETRCSSRCRRRRSCGRARRAPSISSRIMRSASGSPQPGQSECSRGEQQVGLRRRPSPASVVACSCGRLPAVDGGDARDDVRRARAAGPTPKPEWSWLMPPIGDAPARGRGRRAARPRSSARRSARTRRRARTRAAASATAVVRERPERDRPHVADPHAPARGRRARRT